MNHIRWYGPTLVLLATVLGIMVAGPMVTQRLAYVYGAEDIRVVRQSLHENAALAELSEAFRKVSRVVEPSVVHIQVSSRRPPASSRRMLPDLPFPGVPRAPSPESDQFERYNAPQPYGSGSGWVYDNDGHIITNNHVIDGAEQIEVRFADGTRRRATVVNTDPATDVAVLKVEGGNVHPAALARETVEQGDIVFAFGSPFRFEFSMSQGIVSAKGRELNILRRTDSQGNPVAGYERFIQTDAAINPGNSGGPLTNIYGEVVGMNTAIATQSGGNSGLGFAIPIDMVRSVVNDILTKGRVVRGYLGVYIEELDPRIARTFGYEGSGVLVRSPIPGGPAEKAGLKPDDIIARVDESEVNNPEQLRFLIASYAPGATAVLHIFRDGGMIEVPVVIAEMDEGAVAASPAQRGAPDASEQLVLRKLGLERVATVTEEMAQRPELQPGVLVQAIRPGSVAASEGITPGSVIIDVMGTPVRTVEQLAAELNRHDLTKGIRVRVTEFDPRTRTMLPRLVPLELLEN